MFKFASINRQVEFEAQVRQFWLSNCITGERSHAPGRTQ
jgi:hypothetical protein